MNKKIFLTITIFLLVAVLVFLWWSRNRIEAREFAGTVSRVEGDKIFVDGVYLVAERPDLSNPDKRKMVAVLVGVQTRVIKEKLFLPTTEEVEKTGGRYDPVKLKRESVVSSIGELGEGVSITAKASANVFGRPSFTASEITYIEPVFP